MATRLRFIDLADPNPVENRSPEQIREDWRQARAFLREALADAPLTESELFQRAASLGIRKASLWGVLTNLPPCTVWHETRPGGRDGERLWEPLLPEQA